MVCSGDRLCCVITGMEHSGTTLLSQLLHAHPVIASGPECGLLLSKIYDFDRVEPFWSWLLGKEGWSWCLRPEDRGKLLSAKSYEEAYALLARYMGRANSDRNLRKLFERAALIYDKTPAYVHCLDRVVEKVDAPFVVTFKDWLEQAASHLSRYSTLAGFSGVYINAIKKITAVHRRYPGRVLVVSYKSLTLNTESVMKEVGKFLSLPGDYKLTLDQYKRRYGHLISSNNSFRADRIVYSKPALSVENPDDKKRLWRTPGKIRKELSYLNRVAL